MRSTRCRETVGRRKAGLYSCPMDPVVHIPFAGHRAALRGDYSSQQPKWQGACKGWRITAPKGLMKVTDPQHIQAMSMVLWFPRWKILEKSISMSHQTPCVFYFWLKSSDTGNVRCLRGWHRLHSGAGVWHRPTQGLHPWILVVPNLELVQPLFQHFPNVSRKWSCALIAAASQCQSNPRKAFEWLGVQRCFNDACRNARRNSPRHGLHRPWSGWFQLLPSCKRIWEALAVTGIQGLSFRATHSCAWCMKETKKLFPSTFAGGAEDFWQDQQGDIAELGHAYHSMSVVLVGFLICQETGQSAGSLYTSLKKQHWDSRP